MQENKNKKTEKPGFGQIMLSTLAAAIGVQSNKNRERTFRAVALCTTW